MRTSDYMDFDFCLNRAIKILKSEKEYTIAFLAIVGINVGLRISDLRLLTFSQIENGFDTILEKKTKKARTIQFNDHIQKAFQIFRERCKRNDGYLFLSNKRKVYTPQYINRAIKKLFAKPNLSISTHSLRKTFGRRVWDNHNQTDSALIYLSEIFNHADLATTRRYLGIRQEQIKEIYLNL